MAAHAWDAPVDTRFPPLFKRPQMPHARTTNDYLAERRRMKELDARAPRTEAEMFGRHSLFRLHNCSRCVSGRTLCLQGDPNRCEFPVARND